MFCFLLGGWKPSESIQVYKTEGKIGKKNSKKTNNFVALISDKGSVIVFIDNFPLKPVGKKD